MVVGEEAQNAYERRLETNRKHQEREKRKIEECEEKAGQSSGEAEKAAKKSKTMDPETLKKVTIYVEIHPYGQIYSRYGCKE